ncbi:MAG: pantetheine-phosphate adenylyltransferase [Clostridia bacterium]|nr:pantetheine-phosphate adenylyltransferase [Clostridia bacterium]
MKKCIFAGSFDPITKGHIEMIQKAAELFDEVYVAVGINPDKKYLFPIDKRMKFIEKACKNIKNVNLSSFDGAIVDFMKEHGIKYNVRGIRNTRDLEYENSMNFFNARLLPGVTTIYFPCDNENVYISSTAVRELLRLGEDIAPYVPDGLEKDIVKEYRK